MAITIAQFNMVRAIETVSLELGRFVHQAFEDGAEADEVCEMFEQVANILAWTRTSGEVPHARED